MEHALIPILIAITAAAVGINALQQRNASIKSAAQSSNLVMALAVWPDKYVLMGSAVTLDSHVPSMESLSAVHLERYAVMENA